MLLACIVTIFQNHSITVEIGRLHEIFPCLIPQSNWLNTAVLILVFCSTFEIQFKAVIKLDHFSQKHIMDTKVHKELDYSGLNFSSLLSDMCNAT